MAAFHLKHLAGRKRKNSGATAVRGSNSDDRFAQQIS
jgi:hypothetical protein